MASLYNIGQNLAFLDSICVSSNLIMWPVFIRCYTAVTLLVPSVADVFLDAGYNALDLNDWSVCCVREMAQSRGVERARKRVKSSRRQTAVRSTRFRESMVIGCKDCTATASCRLVLSPHVVLPTRKSKSILNYRSFSVKVLVIPAPVRLLESTRPRCEHFDVFRQCQQNKSPFLSLPVSGTERKHCRTERGGKEQLSDKLYILFSDLATICGL